MWTAKPVILDQNTHKIYLFDGESPLSYQDVIRHWREDSEFRDFYFSTLQDSPFDAFFWENPPVTTETIRQAYEFVLVNSTQLTGVTADPSSFQDKFDTNPSAQNVIAFENLGRDAELIVPRALVSKYIYAHIASFVRMAPEYQKHDLFVVMANSLNGRINNKPTWVSTSGLGVYWLHIRLDTKPKYYTHQAYRNFTKKDSGELL